MSHFDISSLKNELSNLENETLQDGFWNDAKKSGIILQKIKTIKNKVENFNNLSEEIENLIDMSELLIEETDDKHQDNSLIKDILNNTNIIQNKLDDLEISTLLSGKYDINNAIVTIHPGAGGTESQDWAEMLYRMYCRWSNSMRLHSTRIRLFRWR